MKQIVRYKVMTIPNKLSAELRITVDETRSSEYTSTFEGGVSTNLTLFPILSVQMIQVPDGGDPRVTTNKSGWNPGTSIGLTRFTLPIFLSELKSINRNLRKPDLYSYRGPRLELNLKEAERIRSVFMIGNTTIEMAPVVIDSGETKLEGIKMKFNNESATVLLTVNELTVFVHNLDRVQMDTMALLMYTNYITKMPNNVNYHNPRPRTIDPVEPVVDIEPKKDVVEDTPTVVETPVMDTPQVATTVDENRLITVDAKMEGFKDLTSEFEKYN